MSFPAMMKAVLRVFLVTATLVLYPLYTNGYDHIDDFVNIEVIDDEVIAFRTGRPSAFLELRSGETVRWSSASGHLGAVLTNDRFAVVSTTGFSWKSIRLKSGEIVQQVPLISEKLTLLVTEKRIITFDVDTRHFVESRLFIQDEFLAAKVDELLAVVVTSDRAIAMASGRKKFIEADFRSGESFESLKLNKGFATVRTNKRLLKFQLLNTSWQTIRY